MEEAVPAGLIVARIEEWVRENAALHHDAEGNEVWLTPFDVSERLGVNMQALRKQEHISFTSADRILCQIDRWTDWYNDPILAEVYQRVEFHSKDWELELEGDTEALAKRQKKRESRQNRDRTKRMYRKGRSHEEYLAEKREREKRYRDANPEKVRAQAKERNRRYRAARAA